MEGLGYGAGKPLKVKVVDAQHPALSRSRRCILIDQLKKIYIEGELEVDRHQRLVSPRCSAGTTRSAST